MMLLVFGEAEAEPRWMNKENRQGFTIAIRANFRELHRVEMD